MAVTTQQQLDAVDEAIHAFMLDGAIQSYTVLGRTVMRAQLRELQDWRKQLKAELSSESEGLAVNHYRRGPL